MIDRVLVTGSAGFIGFYLCKDLLERGFDVIGIDNINSYYDPKLKGKRLEILSKISLKDNTWNFFKTDLLKKETLLKIFNKYKPSTVVNLAAQAGVRYSKEKPDEYINSNIVGFSNILECCRTLNVKTFLYSSSSSVYGGNTKIPFSENDSVNHPVSLYAATKRSNELIAHTYSHLYGISCTGLRLFTVYGPWGRPDMAPMIFANSIFNKKEIEIFNYGKMSRSFTYIDDVIEPIQRLIKKPASIDRKFNTNNPNPSTSWCPHRIFNIGNNKSVELDKFISLLEKEIGITAIKKYTNMPLGDVKVTLSDNSILKDWIGEMPYTSLELGIKKFVNWYRKYYDY